MCRNLALAMLDRSSAARCCGLPLPIGAVADQSGLARAASINSFSDSVRGCRRDEHQRKCRDQGHRLKIAERIVGHVLEQAGVDGHLARRAEQHRVAVRRTFSDARRPDHAGSPRLVLDDNRLAQELRELLRHGASGDVRAAARRVGNDQLDWLCGIRALLRRRRRRRARKGQKECCAKKQLASRQETTVCHPDVMRTASDASITARPARWTGPGCRTTSHKPEIVRAQAAQSHILQHDRILRVQGDDRVVADLLAGGPDGLEVLEHAAAELDDVVVAEVANGVVAKKPDVKAKTSLPLPPVRKSSPPPPASLSLPLPPERRSSPRPPSRSSLPLPSPSTSLPRPPISTSLPFPPETTSLPSRPSTRSLPLPPFIVSLPVVPARSSLPLPPLKISGPIRQSR